LQINKQTTLDPKTLHIFFLKGIREDYLETLNLMGAGDASQPSYEEICELCKQYYRESANMGKIRKILYLGLVDQVEWG